MKSMKNWIVIAFMFVTLGISAQSVDEILAKYFENTGGIQNWRNLKSLKFIGKAVSVAKQRRPSGTSPIPSRATRCDGNRPTSCPAKEICPSEGIIRMAQRTVVVLPIPLRPISATASPSPTLRLTP
jgi:hypothetical protein